MRRIEQCLAAADIEFALDFLGVFTMAREAFRLEQRQHLEREFAGHGLIIGASAGTRGVEQERQDAGKEPGESSTVFHFHEIP